MKIKTGDKVVILRGKDKGRKGKVQKAIPSKGKVVVEGINVYKKHMKPRKEGEEGGIIDIVKPMDVSKVALVCPNCDEKTRVGYRVTKSGKERICKKCQGVV
jgi:large subunit ribosomal protein L24